jgi:hypothetical protein
VPVFLYVPWQVAHGGLHGAPRFPRWASALSQDVGRLLFVCCIMPFFLDFVAHFDRESSCGEDARKGLLGRALGYGVVVFAVEVALGLLLRPLQMRLPGTPGMGALISQSLIGLAIDLITSIPTIICVVAIALMAMRADVPVTEAEPA